MRSFMLYSASVVRAEIRIWEREVVKMKKLITYFAFLLTMLLISGSLSAFAVGSNESLQQGDWQGAINEEMWVGAEESFDSEVDYVKVVINGEELTFPDASPFVDAQGRTQVPIRFIAEAMDAEVAWDGEAKRVDIERGETSISLTIGSNVIIVSGETIVMDTAPVILNDWTFVPIRYVSEGFGAQVEWDGEKKTVDITIARLEPDPFGRDFEKLATAFFSLTTSEFYTIDDVRIGKYYGVINDCIIISMYLDKAPVNAGWIHVNVAGYVFMFTGLNRMIFTNGEFLNVAMAYERGIFSKKDVYEFGVLTDWRYRELPPDESFAVRYPDAPTD